MGIRSLTSAAMLLAATGALVWADVQQLASRAPRTGIVVGQVIDGTSGAAIGEAVVQLTLQGAVENTDSPNSRVIADAEGRFFFTHLPAGRYFLQATKDGYARGAFRQLLPWGRSQSLILGEGERRADVELRVWKYAVIGGTVLDEAGEPVVGVAVRALARDVFGGRTRYGNMELIQELVPSAVTDDRGMFRLSQLSPGTFVVLVPSTHTTLPASYLVRPDTALRNDLFWGGVHEMTPLGQPRTTQIGDFALMTLNRVLIPPPPSPNGQLQVYRTTFYPAAPTAASATPITVKSGEERSDVTINLRPVPAVRVSGRLVTADGSAPPPMMIRLEGGAMTDVVTAGSPTGPDAVGFETASAMSDGRGRFTFLGVPAGDYLLRQGNRFLARPLEEGNPSYWTSQPLTVGRENIEDVVVELRPALQVAGQVEYRGDDSAPPRPAVAGVTFETPFGGPGQVFASVDRQALTFSTFAAGGQYIIRPNESAGWVVQSVTIDGKDVTDRIVDLQSHTTSIAVTYTHRRSKVSGTITTSDGTAAESAVALVFPIDEQRWSGYGGSPRTLRSAIPAKGGLYTFEHLPPGDYYVIAVDLSQVDGWRDPARLEVLATQATRVSVAPGDTLKTVDLRVKGTR